MDTRSTPPPVPTSQRDARRQSRHELRGRGRHDGSRWLVVGALALGMHYTHTLHNGWPILIAIAAILRRWPLAEIIAQWRGRQASAVSTPPVPVVQPPLGRRISRYLTSGKNIAGSALGLGALGLVFGGVIGPGWPLIVLAAYAAGALAWPAKKADADMTFEGVSNEALIAQLHALKTRLDGRLPAAAMQRLAAIEATLGELLPRLDTLRASGAITAQSSFTVHETLRRYLPDALGSYLKLPPNFARMQAIENGRTAADILGDQLATLDDSLKEIARQAYLGDATALLESERFLADKFAQSSPFRMPDK